MKQTLRIKNMVCDRCIKAVRQIMEDHALSVEAVELGQVVVSGEDFSKEKLSQALQEEGFALLEDPESRLIEEVKGLLRELIHQEGLSNFGLKLSEYLAEKTQVEYTRLSHRFSEFTGTTIEKYFIQQKIEKIKEWLEYGEMPLKEIAFRLGFSSEAYLSNQFKKMTGYTPGEYRKKNPGQRRTLDSV